MEEYLPLLALLPIGGRPGKSPGRPASLRELRLPPGYHLQWDPDLLLLRRPEGSVAAA